MLNNAGGEFFQGFIRIIPLVQLVLNTTYIPVVQRIVGKTKQEHVEMVRTVSSHTDNTVIGQSGNVFYARNAK